MLATASPDRLLPSTACDLQALLGADNAAAFDIGAACPGFVYALTVAEGLIASGQSETVLVVGAEKLSAITDFQDRSTAILFGDGAGAAIVRRSSQPGRGILATFIKSDGRLAPLLYRPGGGSADPISEQVRLRAVPLHEDGRPRGVQGRRPDHGRRLRRGPPPGRRHRGPGRPAGSAPGQPPDHRGHRQARRASRWTRSW